MEGILRSTEEKTGANRAEMKFQTPVDTTLNYVRWQLQVNNESSHLNFHSLLSFKHNVRHILRQTMRIDNLEQ